LAKVTQQKKLTTEYNYLKGRLEKITRFDNIIGRSAPMQEIFGLIPDIAASDTSVLLTGETGTGKEMVAKAIHAKSPRSNHPFIAINCGAIPDTLLASELFGHRKGAFTDASFSRKGFLEVVAGGTLFLDEVGEISSKMQIDLLRVLEEKKITKIGSSEPIEVNFRLISATRRDLEQAILKRDFREDFYYRINVIRMHVPPLRERREDIPLLAQHFIDKYSQETAKKVDHISRETLSLLKQYEWPGNVRELENAIERAVVLSRSRTLKTEDFGFLAAGSPQSKKTRTLKEMEQAYICETLLNCDWNITRAAEVLGINRVTLHKKIDRYELRNKRK
jgi:two-component system response regulator HydG